jgi:hypothetical protein
MRQTLFFIAVAFALSLAGCASSPNTGVYARVPDSQIRPKFAVLPGNKSPSRHAWSHHKALDQAIVVIPEPKSADPPEPRPNSKEWWLRENERVGKAIVICRGCLPSTIANVSQPKATLPSSTSSTQALQ